MKTTRKHAPKHLSEASKAIWRRTLDDFDLEDHHLLVLEAALDARDRMIEARERIAADGPYISDRYGKLKAHPGVAVERDSRIAFLRAMRELGLDAPAAEAPRPPALPHYSGVS